MFIVILLIPKFHICIFLPPPDSDSSDVSGCTSCGRPIDFVSHNHGLELCTLCLDSRQQDDSPEQTVEVKQRSAISSSLLTNSRRLTDFSISKLTASDSNHTPFRHNMEDITEVPPSKRQRLFPREPRDSPHLSMTSSESELYSPNSSREMTSQTTVQMSPVTLNQPVDLTSRGHQHVFAEGQGRSDKELRLQQRHPHWMTSQAHRADVAPPLYPTPPRIPGSYSGHTVDLRTTHPHIQGHEMIPAGFLTSFPPMLGYPAFLGHHGAVDLRRGQSYVAAGQAQMSGGYILPSWLVR